MITRRRGKGWYLPPPKLFSEIIEKGRTDSVPHSSTIEAILTPSTPRPTRVGGNVNLCSPNHATQGVLIVQRVGATSGFCFGAAQYTLKRLEPTPRRLTELASKRAYVVRDVAR